MPHAIGREGWQRHGAESWYSLLAHQAEEHPKQPWAGIDGLGTFLAAAGLLNRNHGKSPQLPERRSLQHKRSSPKESSAFRAHYVKEMLTLLGKVSAFNRDIKPRVNLLVRRSWITRQRAFQKYLWVLRAVATSKSCFFQLRWYRKESFKRSLWSPVVSKRMAFVRKWGSAEF